MARCATVADKEDVQGRPSSDALGRSGVPERCGVPPHPRLLCDRRAQNAIAIALAPSHSLSLVGLDGLGAPAAAVPPPTVATLLRGVPPAPAGWQWRPGCRASIASVSPRCHGCHAFDFPLFHLLPLTQYFPSRRAGCDRRVPSHSLPCESSTRERAPRRATAIRVGLAITG